jgi:iron complex outermembrane receptor protein
MKHRAPLRRPASWLFALALFWAGPASAAGTLFVSVPAPGDTTVTLKARGGSTESFQNTAAQFQVSPRAGAGSYEVTIEHAGQKETATVELPIRGQVQVVFNPATTPKIQVYVAAVEEITVTAQRIEESVQEIPLAVTAFGESSLEAARATNIREVAERVPNFFLENNTGLSSGFRATIRGVGEDESFFSADTPVGVYVDDIYIPRQSGAMFDLFDLDRIEVLRGAQGTLYGRNTTAGAVRFVSRQPGNQFRFNVDGTVGEYKRNDFRAGITIPAGEKLSIQAGAMRRNHEGYATNAVDGRKLNDQDVWGGRLSLRIMPSPRVNVLLVGDFLRDRSQPAFPEAFRDQPPPVAPANAYGNGPYVLSQTLDGDGDVFRLNSDLSDPLNDFDQRGLSGTITVNLDDRTTLKSITGYRKFDFLLLLDADGRVGNFLNIPRLVNGVLRPAPSFHLFQDQRQSQWSQELQLQGRPSDRLRYVLGFYYFREKNAQVTENLVFNFLGFNNYTNVGLKTDSYAGYGSATYQATDRLTLTVGARYTNDSKDYRHQVYLPNGPSHPLDRPLVACVNRATGLPVTGGGARACLPTDPAGSSTFNVGKAIDDSWNAFTPRFAVDYQASPQVLLYATASRGFKSAAFDGRLNGVADVYNLAAIPPERLWSYEAGFKSDLAQRKLRLNVAAFYNDWNDLQGTGTNPAGNFVRISAGDVSTKGLEFEAKVVPTRGLELTGQLGLLDTKYRRINFNQSLICLANGTATLPIDQLELKGAPHTSYFLGANYTTPRVAGGAFSFGGDVSGKSRFFHTSCNTPGGSEDGYTLANAFAAYETNDGRWRLTLAVDNLNDEKYLTGSFFIGGLRMFSGYINPPRRVSFTVRYSYN